MGLTQVEFDLEAGRAKVELVGVVAGGRAKLLGNGYRYQ